MTWVELIDKHASGIGFMIVVLSLIAMFILADLIDTISKERKK